MYSRAHDGVLLNVPTSTRREVMGNETHEEELIQNVCNLECYTEEKVLLSSKKEDSKCFEHRMFTIR